MAKENPIAQIGQNSTFVAFMAHAGFGYGVVFTTWAASGSRADTFKAALIMLVFAAVKEFWFDAKYEKNPPQTAKDNWLDFAGYAGGTLLALAVAAWLAR